MIELDEKEPGPAEMVLTLLERGFTYAKIGEMIGRTGMGVRHIVESGSDPRYSHGKRLEKLYSQYKDVPPIPGREKPRP